MEPYSEDFLALVDEFNSKGKVLVVGGFGPSMEQIAHSQVKKAFESAIQQGKNHCVFIIDSSGGLITTLQAWIGAIHIFKPIKEFYLVGIVLGKAYSAACDLLQYMDWRVAQSHASLLVHYGTTQLSNWDQGLILSAPKSALSFEKSRNMMFLELYSKRSGGKLNPKQVGKLSLANQSITAAQALQLGLIDELVDIVPSQSFRPDYIL